MARHRQQEIPMFAVSCTDFDQKLTNAFIRCLDFSKEIKVLPNFKTLLESKGISYGSPISGEIFWAIEDICVRFENEWEEYPKVIEATPLDRYAYSKMSGLRMEAYFDRIIPSFVSDCTAFFYEPVVSNCMAGEFAYNVDEAKRSYIVSNKLHVQLLAASFVHNVDTMKECVRLKFPGAVRGV